MIRKLITGTFLLVSIYLSVNADTVRKASTDSIAHQFIPEITIRGILTEKLNLPFQVMTAEEIENHVFITPADALHHLPGVSLSRDGAWATSVNIRGFSESKLLFMMDGDRFQTATDIAGVLSMVNIDAIERIEVVKGAGSVLFGTGALGGVVNFIPKRPDYSAGGFKTGGNVSTGLQLVNRLWHNNISAYISERDWYLGVDGSYRTANDTQTPAGKIDGSQFNDASFSVRGGMKHGDNRELLMNYSHHNAWDVGLPGGVAFPATAKVRYLSFIRNQLSGEYIFRNLSDEVQQVSIKAYTQNIHREVENRVSQALSIFPGSSNTTSGLKAVADLYFNAYNTMTLGAETWLRDQSTKRVRIASLATDTIFTGEQPTPNANVLDVGVFSHYQWVIDPKYWTLNAGLRLDYLRTSNEDAYREVFKFKYANGTKQEMTHNNALLFAEDVKNEFAYSAHIDMMYRPAERHKLIFSLANAYRVASLEERFKFIDQSGILRVGNPDLKPEKGAFSNLSYTLTGNFIVLKAEVYANYLFDLITEEKANYTYPGGTTVEAWINRNVNQALFYGAEMEMKWLISPALSFEQYISYVYGGNAITGDKLPLVPPLNGVMSLHYHVSNIGELTASLDWEYETEEHAPGIAPHRHGILNLVANTEPVSLMGVAVKFTLGVKNLLNYAYQEHLSTLRGINRLEPGRNFFVKAKMNW
jgi:hemoglobin/transferrin/lactoferrin receptor protein